VGNTVTGGGHGIVAAGFRKAFVGRTPGKCSGDANRYCATDADCKIAGVDSAGKGVCAGVTTQRIDARAKNSVIEENNLIGPFTTDAISASGTVNATIRRNVIHGGGSERGIAIRSYALETATVTGNAIDGTAMGLFLDHTNNGDSSVDPAAGFGASVFLNDVTASTVRAIGVTNGYKFASELSVGGEGNYWGHTCAEGGFWDRDTPDAVLIRDSHPFGVPVASKEKPEFPPCY